MIGLAFQQLLKARGYTVRYGGLGNYRNDLVFAVVDAPGGDEGLYPVSLQVLARAPDAVSAVEGLREVYEVMLGLRYSEVAYEDPLDASRNRTYHVRWIEALQRPTYVPSPTPGEEATVNFRVYVREP